MVDRVLVVDSVLVESKLVDGNLVDINLVVGRKQVVNREFSGLSFNSGVGHNMSLRWQGSVGDPCFAKVRGFTPWPAKIVGKKTVESEKKKYSVVFYETEETADVNEELIWEITPENAKKFVSKKLLKRKYFEPAVVKMQKHHKIAFDLIEGGSVGAAETVVTKIGQDNTTEEKEHEVDTRDETADDEFAWEFDDIFRGSGSGVKASHYEDTDSEDEDQEDEIGDSMTCSGCGKTFEDKKLYLSHMVDHAVDEVSAAFKSANEVAATEGVDEQHKNDESNSDVGLKASNKKIATSSSKKGKTSNNKKKGKTLRESEQMVDDAFAERIIVKDDNTFHCKVCPTFVTNVLLLARSHAQSCSIMKKKKGRQAKNLDCAECGETFKGKAALVQHTRQNHHLPSYRCSTCGKKFTKRTYYMRHLQMHETPLFFSCTYCPKKFRFKSYKERHIRKVHQKVLNRSEMAEVGAGGEEVMAVTASNKKDANDDEMVVSVHTEEKLYGENLYWKYEAKIPEPDRVRSASGVSFYNSLGFSSKDEWDEWMMVSEMLKLPYSADGSDEGFEFAITKEENGDETIVCVGSRINTKTVDEQVKSLVLELADLAVYVSSKENEENDISEKVVKETVSEEGVIEHSLRSFARYELTTATTDTVEESRPEVESPPAGPSGTEPAQKSVQCGLCGQGGFRNSWFLRRHLQRMHVGSITCNICDIVFMDKYHYLQHSSSCFYWCSRPGCSFHTKKKTRLESHDRDH